MASPPRDASPSTVRAMRPVPWDAVGSQLDAVTGSAPLSFGPVCRRPPFGVSMTRKLRPSAGVVKDRDVMRTAFLCQEALSLSLTVMLACDPKV